MSDILSTLYQTLSIYTLCAYAQQGYVFGLCILYYQPRALV